MRGWVFAAGCVALAGNASAQTTNCTLYGNQMTCQQHQSPPLPALGLQAPRLQTPDIAGSFLQGRADRENLRSQQLQNQIMQEQLNQLQRADAARSASRRAEDEVYITRIAQDILRLATDGQCDAAMARLRKADEAARGENFDGAFFVTETAVAAICAK